VQPTLTEKSYHILREKLFRGEFKPGAQLVNRTLAKEIGVSMSPVREAINRLSQEGVVVQVPGAGAFVRQFSLRELEDIYIVREALEGCAAAEAAQNAAPRDIMAIESIWREWRGLVRAIGNEPEQTSSIEQASQWAEIDERFHRQLVGASGNELLEKIVVENRLIARVFMAAKGAEEIFSFHRAAWDWKDHGDLLRAIRNRDPDEARRLSDFQIRRGRKKVLSLLRDRASVFQALPNHPKWIPS
jgi:DNA-binding GntR family transcriptional regulator